MAHETSAARSVDRVFSAAMARLVSAVKSAANAFSAAVARVTQFVKPLHSLSRLRTDLLSWLYPETACPVGLA